MSVYTTLTLLALDYSVTINYIIKSLNNQEKGNGLELVGE